MTIYKRARNQKFFIINQKPKVLNYAKYFVGYGYRISSILESNPRIRLGSADFSLYGPVL